MDTDNYWSRFQRARITRRRLLAGAAATGAGAAAIALVGCGGDDNKGGSTPSGAQSPSAGKTVTTGNSRQTEPVGTRGGMQKYFGFDALALDTFDPHQTQFGPIYSAHSAVFSKVMEYDDEVTQKMSPDLAESAPEHPDELTYIIKLRKGVKFHDQGPAAQAYPQVAGRELTAEDVVYSIERQRNQSSPNRALYYRSGQWATIDKINTTDNYTIRITTKEPVAPFLHYLADRNAHIVAKETVDANDVMKTDKEMLGTGPFYLDRFSATEVVRVKRNPNWFLKDGRPDLGTDRPFIDGYEALWTPQSDSAQEAALKSKQVDSTGFADDANLQRIQNETSGLNETSALVGGWVNTRLWLSEKGPLSDFRLRRALHLAADRKALGEQMFPSGSGRRGWIAVGPVTTAMELWALPQRELEDREGYRTSQQGRDEDIKTARDLWEAAGGPSSLKAIFANVPAYIAGKALPQIKTDYNNNLGLTLDEEIDPTGYTILAQCLLRNTSNADEGTCAFTFGFDNGWIDLDDWVYPYFHTNGTKNSFRLSDSKLDAMIEKQRHEFDLEERQKQGYDIQRYLLDSVLARLDWVTLANRGLNWSYIRNDFTATWFGHNYHFANSWLNADDPNFRGRA